MTHVIYIRCRVLEVVLEAVLREAEAWMIMRLPLLSQAGVEVGEAMAEVLFLRVLHRRVMKRLLAILHRCKLWLSP